MRRAFRLSAETLTFLIEYSWPGNVRELSNSIDGACSMTSGEVIEIGAMSTSIRDAWMHATVSRRQPTEKAAPGSAVETLAEMENGQF